MVIKRDYSRRGFLKRLGGTTAVTALSPFVPLLEADAANGAPLRYLYWYTPVHPSTRLVEQMLPAQEGALQWRGAYSKLNDMRQKMSLFRGLTNAAAYDTNEVGVGGGHRASGCTMLSGWAAQKDALPGDTRLVDTGAGFRGKSTIDQWVAEKLRTEKNIATPLTDIRMGYENRAHTNEAVWKSVSYRNGVIQLRHQSPDTLFEQMFQFAGGGTTSSQSDRRISVLNNVFASIKSVQNRLGHSDKIRLDRHLNAIDEVERQLEASSEGGGSCTIADGLAQTQNRLDTYIDTYIQLVTIAFNCDMTRIAGAQWLSHLSGNVSPSYEFLPESEPVDRYHGVTHGSGKGTQEQKDAFIKAIANYRAETIVKLMQSLDSVVEANGKTMLDNTILHWYTETSADHKWYDQFNVIAGGGSYFKMGVHDIVGTTEKSQTHTQNKLLTSIANAFGFPIEHFGDPKYGSGGLPGRVLV